MNRDLLPFVVVDPFGIDVLAQRYDDPIVLCQMTWEILPQVNCLQLEIIEKQSRGIVLHL